MKKTIAIASTIALLAAPFQVLAQEEGSSLTPEEIEEIRKAVAAQEAAEISDPSEIEDIRRRRLDAEQANEAPGYNNDTKVTLVSRKIDVTATGQAAPHETQSLRLAAGMVTSMSFYDSNGEPWPVQEAAYDKARLSVNNDGCEAQGEAMEAMGNVVLVRPCKFWTDTNMQVLLVGETRPIPFRVTSGSREDSVVADGLLTVAVNSNAPRPYGRNRLGQLDNSWVRPAARTMTIDPIDTERDRGVNQVFVSPGVTTDIAFMDANRNPWPVEEVAYVPGIVAVNGPCDDDSGGIKTVALGGKDGSDGVNTMYITPCQPTNATVAVRMKGRAGALNLMVVAARPGESQPDGTLSVVVPGVSPFTPALTAATASGPGRAGYRSGRSGFTHDAFLNEFLWGTPPQGSTRASVSGINGVEGWVFDGALYLRGAFNIVNPAFDANARSSDGSLSVYKYGPPVSRILATDLTGREVVINVSY